MSNTYFTSDTHFFHFNIISYSKRPFKDVEEMNEKMIEIWNSIVGQDDVIYHLGDFCMGIKEENTPKILKRLNGYKILIRGNHDMKPDKMIAAGFNEVHEKLFIETYKGPVFLCHYPTPNGHWSEQAEYHFCGHIHEMWKKKEKMINVGVDVWDFCPKTAQELFDE